MHLVINVSHLEVTNSANINDIILCFSELIENRITFNISFDQEMAWSIGKKKLCDPLSGDEIIEDCPGEMPYKV